MKRSLIIVASIFAFFLLTSVTCGEPEPFTSIKLIETQIFNEIKTYREANGVAGEFVHQPPVVIEAQLHSIEMAAGVIPVDTAGIQEHWDVIEDKFAGGYNRLVLVQSTVEIDAGPIAMNWTETAPFDSLLLGDFSQCGIGVAYGTTDQLTYVTALLLKYD